MIFPIIRVAIDLQYKYSAIVIPEDAVMAYQHYFWHQAGITLEEYLEALERNGKKS
jgi:hypothetical protein